MTGEEPTFSSETPECLRESEERFAEFVRKGAIFFDPNHRDRKPNFAEYADPDRIVVTRDGYETPFNAQSDEEAAAYKAGWADCLAEIRDEDRAIDDLRARLAATEIKLAAARLALAACADTREARRKAEEV